MKFSEKILQKATLVNRNLVFPESNDIRILTAISLLQKKNIVSNICLIGNKDTISKNLNQHSIFLDEHRTEFIDSETNSKLEEYAHIYYEKKNIKI